MNKKVDNKINTESKLSEFLGKRFHFLSLILIVMFGFIAYTNSLKGEFVYDDEILIENNVFIKSFSQIGNVFTKPIGAGAGLAFQSFYRPLLLVTYSINFAIGKLDVTGYHLVNVLLHISVALCIYWLVYILFNQSILALLTSLFFVVHPIHTEAVSYISGRADSLVCLFLFLSLIIYIKQINGRGSLLGYIFLLATFIATLLSKEYAMILPVLVLLYHVVFQKKIKRLNILSLVAIAAIYIALRLTYLNFVTTSPAIPAESALQRIPGVFVAILTYVKLLFFPFPLHMEYGSRLFQWMDPRVLGGMVLTVSIFIWSYFKRNNPLIVFSVGWFFLTLFPLLNIYKIDAYMGEHFLYLPSLGFFLIGSYYLQQLYQRARSKIPTLILIVLALATFLILTIKQNNYWKDPETFYTTTLKYVPDSEHCYNNLGKLYQEKGHLADALLNFNKALELDPKDHLAYNNRGGLYAQQGKYDEAFSDFNYAIFLKNNYAPAYDNLAHIYDVKGDHAQAILVYTQAIQLNPNYALAYNNRGSAYDDLGDYDKAIEDFTKAIELNSNFSLAYNNRGNAYVNKHDYLNAIADYNKAIEIDPKKESYKHNRSIAYQYQEKSAASF